MRAPRHMAERRDLPARSVPGTRRVRRYNGRALREAINPARFVQQNLPAPTRHLQVRWRFRVEAHIRLCGAMSF